MGHTIIVGAGEVGFHIAERLVLENRDVTIIDLDADRLEQISNSLDVHTLTGKGSSPLVLMDAGIERASLVVAVTDSDEANIVACLVASTHAPESCRKIARIRNPDYFQDDRLIHSRQLGIDFHINPELAAAEKIALLLETPYARDIHVFAEGRVLLLGIRLPDDSPAFDKKLYELAMSAPETHLLAAAIERDGEMLIPSGQDCLMLGDTLFLVSTPQHIKKTLELLGIQHKPLKNVAIAGGGLTGAFIARRLEEKGVAVRLIEADRERCQQLAEELKKTVVLHGDVTDQKLLEEENIGKMDALVAVTGQEEVNFLATLVAKKLGTPKIITLVEKTAFGPLAYEIGADAAIVPREVATNLILRFIRRGDVLQADDVGGAKAEVLEFVAKASSSVIGVKLAEANLPKGMLVGAIVRGKEVMIAEGTSVIQVGDRVIAFALHEAVSACEKCFQPA